MILYHTGDREIRKPDIHHGRKNADFGWGFYLTPDRDFTYRWAGENAVVNEYELDESGLFIHRFDRDTDWFRYIYNNRRLQDGIAADVIIGPIANDTIFDTLGIISSGFLKPEDAIRLLMIGPEYTQVAIKTEKAAEQLHWIGSERIERIARDEYRAEQALISPVIQRIKQEHPIYKINEHFKGLILYIICQNRVVSAFDEYTHAEPGQYRLYLPDAGTIQYKKAGSC